jgi:Putative enzyme of poly-gamma-glutamate biosynthesis (capsule formation)
MLGSDHPSARSLPPRGGAGLLDPFAPVLRAADIAFGNLEGPLLDGGKPYKKAGPRSFAFRTPTAYGRHLKAAGFDVLSCANNHASDFGPPGREATRRTLEALGIAHAGIDRDDVAFLTRKGKRVAVLAFAHNPVNAHVRDVAGAAQRVKEATRAGADLVIVSFHGGAEGTGARRVPRGREVYLGEDRGDLRRFARAVVDAGADLVLGHGPHVLRGMEVYRRRLIAYSLGNFATYGMFTLTGALGETLVLEARLDPATGAFVSGKIHPGRQRKPGGPRPDPSGEAIESLRSLSRADFGAAAPLIARDGTLSPPA